MLSITQKENILTADISHKILIQTQKHEAWIGTRFLPWSGLGCELSPLAYVWLNSHSPPCLEGWGAYGWWDKMEGSSSPEASLWRLYPPWFPSVFFASCQMPWNGLMQTTITNLPGMRGWNEISLQVWDKVSLRGFKLPLLGILSRG